MSNPVFYASPAELGALTVGASFTLAGDEGRHAATVKRLAVGEPVDMCDGAGLRLVCSVAAAGKGVLEVLVGEVVREPAPAITLTLVQALAKGDRDEMAIETATELGIDAVVPWQAERSIVRWKMDKAVKGPQKWRHVVAGAAKQSRRSTIPEVLELVGTAGVKELIAGSDLALILHEDAGCAVADLAREWFLTLDGAVAEPQRVLLIVGPEGGISPAEVAEFEAAGAKPALLGRHVLRSSTAGPAAVVLLNHELGRWS